MDKRGDGERENVCLGVAVIIAFLSRGNLEIWFWRNNHIHKHRTEMEVEIEMVMARYVVLNLDADTYVMDILSQSCD